MGNGFQYCDEDAVRREIMQLLFAKKHYISNRLVTKMKNN